MPFIFSITVHTIPSCWHTLCRLPDVLLQLVYDVCDCEYNGRVPMHRVSTMSVPVLYATSHEDPPRTRHSSTSI